MNKQKFYHGTSDELIADIIDEEGLRGGYNEVGGTHGRWKIPRLFLVKDIDIAKKYGQFIFEVYVDELRTIRVIDGVGDECFIIEGDGILVEAKDIFLE
jgi:hypothetical protein